MFGSRPLPPCSKPAVAPRSLFLRCIPATPTPCLLLPHTRTAVTPRGPLDNPGRLKSHPRSIRGLNSPFSGGVAGRRSGVRRWASAGAVFFPTAVSVGRSSSFHRNGDLNLLTARMCIKYLVTVLKWPVHIFSSSPSPGFSHFLDFSVVPAPKLRQVPEAECQG